MNPTAAEYGKLDIRPELPAYCLVQLIHFEATQPYWAMASLQTARSLGALCLWEEAREVLREMVWHFPVRPAIREAALGIRAAAWSELGFQYGRRGQFRQARAWLTKAHQSNPRDIWTQIRLAETLARQARWTEAEDVLQACPGGEFQEERDYWLGWVLRGQERWPEAAQHWARCSEARATDAMLDLQLALRGDCEAPGAGPVCQLLWGRGQVGTPSEQADRHHTQATALAEMGRGKEAWRALRRAWGLIPQPGFRRASAAQVHDGLRHFRKAAELYQSLPKTREAAGLVLAGRCRYQVGDLVQAEKCFRAALHCDQALCDEAWLWLGKVLRSMERFVEAEECFQESLHIDSDNRAAPLALEDVRLAQAFRLERNREQQARPARSWRVPGNR